MAKEQFTIRVDEELLERIKRDAEKESRNTNLQIEFMLKQYYRIKDSLSKNEEII